MFLTIEKLHIAKKQLIASATIWLDSKERLISQQHKIDWLEAANAKTREEMQNILREKDFPFNRFDIVLDEIPTATPEEAPDKDRGESTEFAAVVHIPQEPEIFLRSNYICNEENNEVLSGLCHLTNLLEQLHLLEQLVAPMESFVQLKPLDFARVMTESIINEWPLAAKGDQTVVFYRQRLEITKEYYSEARQINSEAFRFSEEHLAFRRAQFDDTLSCFVKTLGEAYSSVGDDRFFPSLRAYLPWHATLNQLAINLFEKDGVIHPNLKLMNIAKTKLTEMKVLFITDHRKPIEQSKTEHFEKCTVIEKNLKSIESKIESMSSNLKAIIQFGQKRNTTLFMPQGLLSIMGFFNALGSVYQSTTPQRSSIEQSSATYNEHRFEYQIEM